MLEHATRALSPAAERKFALLLARHQTDGGVCHLAVVAGSSPASAERARSVPLRSRRPRRPVRATTDERARHCPETSESPEPLDTLTHGVTIRRAPRDVWPWLIQMGAGTRGGWYSYDWLDNGRQPSRDAHRARTAASTIGTIFPRCQASTEGFTLLAIEHERVLTLGWLAMDGTPAVTWAFVLHEVAPG